MFGEFERLDESFRVDRDKGKEFAWLSILDLNNPIHLHVLNPLDLEHGLGQDFSNFLVRMFEKELDSVIRCASKRLLSFLAFHHALIPSLVDSPTWNVIVISGTLGRLARHGRKPLG